MTVYLLVSANISFGTFNHMNNCLLNNITNTVITILNIEDIKRDAVLTSEPLDLFFAPKYCEIRIVVDTLITFSTTMTIFII